jgi:hypothetical protein
MKTRTATLLCAFALLVSVQTACAAGKAIWHYVSLPLIEGAGIYGGVASLVDDNASLHTQIAGGTNLGLIAAQGVLGMTAALSKGDARLKIRKVHRVLGFVITGAALWMGIANSVDGTSVGPQVGSYGYAALSTVPLIMFKF